MEANYSELQLPGFRFHPTEEELLDFYLKKMVSRRNTHIDIIGYLNIYLYDPWVLPGLSKIGEREWYFFVPRDRKHGSGGRPNRTTQNGFWKATGSDRKIFGLSNPKKHLGLKKTLVFYKGRAPRGSKTDWVMNEYRLPDSCPLPKDIVLCKIYRKATSMKVLEQRAAMEEETKTIQEAISFYTHNDDLAAQLPPPPPPSSPTPPPTEPCHVVSNDDDDLLFFLDEKSRDESQPMESCHVPSNNNDELKAEPDVISDANSSNDNNDYGNVNKVSNIKLPIGDGMLRELQLPKMNVDWTQDSFWTQLRSPWLDNLMFASPYAANILNF